MKKRVLFLVLHRKDRSPGQRYRHEQYIDYLEKNGFECEFSPMLNEDEDRIFYSSGHYLRKILIGLKCLLKRRRDARRAKDFDLVYIYRDAFFFGTFIEKKVAKSGTPIIYDFDDAIWLKDENPNQGLFNKLKTPEKVPMLIGLSKLVIVGNEHLAEYSKQFNENVRIIPSTVDLDEYQLIEKEEQREVCVGWTGSFSTLKHFESVESALMMIKSKYFGKVRFKLIGVPEYANEDLDLKVVPWKSETEVEDLSELDVGIMPLPDNQWTQGKCAMKGLQYMALGIPTIMSPVGVNQDIIQNGENGMLAKTDDQWIDKLSILIENRALAKSIGERGRLTVERDFSTESNKKLWLEAFTSVS